MVIADILGCCFELTPVLFVNGNIGDKCTVVLQSDRVLEYETGRDLRVQQGETGCQHSPHGVADDSHLFDAQDVQKLLCVRGKEMETVVDVGF